MLGVLPLKKKVCVREHVDVFHASHGVVVERDE